MVLWSAILVVRGASIGTSVFELIPQTEVDETTRAAYDRFAHRLGGRIVMLVSGPDAASAGSAADFIAARMARSGLFEESMSALDERTQKDFYQLFFPVRWQVLNAENERLAARGDVDGLVKKSLHRLYQPVLGVPGELLVQDPFFLFADYAISLPGRAEGFMPVDGRLMMEKDGRFHSLVTAVGKGDSFGGAAADRMVDTIERASTAARKQWVGTEVRWTGMVKYAADAARSAQSEVSIIGTGSIVGILLLMLLSFRSLRESLLSLIPILVGLSSGFVITGLVFTRIHVITLVFGSSLVGVCIDYSVHYFTHARSMSSGVRSAVLNAILPGLTMGLVTSVIGYAALAVAPFPGLQQMALFGSVGLVGAFFSVVAWFPFLYPNRMMTFTPMIARLSAAFARRIGGRVLPGAALLGIVFIPGVTQLRADDDIRLLRPENRALSLEEKEITHLLGAVDRSRFIIVEGPDETRLAENERRLTDRLDALIEDGALGGYMALTRVIPPLSVQQRNFDFMKKVMGTPSAQDYFTAMGLNDNDRKRLETGLPFSPLFVSRAVARSAMSPYRMMWLGAIGDRVASVVMLEDIQNAPAVAKVANGTGFSHYVDKVAEVSSLFARYRVVSTWLMAAAFALICAFVLFRYGPRRGVRIMALPALTTIFILGTIGFLGIHVNIFTFLGLLLVLATGIDYTLFFAESHNDQGPTAFSVTLCALTTVLSFGLLALSSTPALTHLGGVMLAGIILSALLSPLAKTDS